MKQKNLKKLIIAVCAVALVAWIVLLIAVFGRNTPANEKAEVTPTLTPEPTAEQEKPEKLIFRQTKAYYNRRSDGGKTLFYETVCDEHGKPIRFDQYDRYTGELLYSKNVEYDEDGNLFVLPQYDCVYFFMYDKEQGLTYMNRQLDTEEWDIYNYRQEVEAVVDANGRTVWNAAWFEEMEHPPINPFDAEGVFRTIVDNKSPCMFYYYTYKPDGRLQAVEWWCSSALYHGEYVYLNDNDPNPDHILFQMDGMDTDIRQFEYDASGRLLSEADYSFEVEKDCHDSNGRVLPSLQNAPRYKVWENLCEYDAEGRMTMFVLQSKVTATYGAPGDPGYSTEIYWDKTRYDYTNLENGHRKEVLYDPETAKNGEVAEHKDVLEYDLNGNLIRVDFYGGGFRAGIYGSGEWGFSMEYETYHAEKGDYDGDAVQRKMIHDFVDQRNELVQTHQFNAWGY